MAAHGVRTHLALKAVCTSTSGCASGSIAFCTDRCRCFLGSFFDYLADRGTLPEAEALFYVANVASAVSYLHSCSVVFRDLKPGPITAPLRNTQHHSATLSTAPLRTTQQHSALHHSAMQHSALYHSAMHHSATLSDAQHSAMHH